MVPRPSREARGRPPADLLERLPPLLPLLLHGLAHLLDLLAGLAELPGLKCSNVNNIFD